MGKRKGISVEERLYEAFRRGEGVRLSADEVDLLVGPDDAIRSRICNKAANDAGINDVHGHDDMGMIPNLPWKKFVESFKQNYCRTAKGAE